MPVVKVSEAAGPVLDWMVAKCEGYHATIKSNEVVYVHPSGEWHHNGNWCPSRNWAQGGSIIEREKIELIPPKDEDDNEWMAVWYKCEDAEAGIQVGTSPLIAAMRCYVASKLGKEVEVPDELT